MPVTVTELQRNASPIYHNVFTVGPQTITSRGRPDMILVDADKYREMERVCVDVEQMRKVISQQAG